MGSLHDPLFHAMLASFAGNLWIARAVPQVAARLTTATFLAI